MSISKIQDNTSLHHFRTELPNILFDLGLPCDLIGFYAYLKRVAGDKGGCWRSTPTMAKENGCSENKIRSMKKELQKKNQKLGIPLIKITTKRKAKDNGTLADLITITDLWGINFQTLSTPSKPKSPPLQNLNPPPSKFEPLKEEQYKKNSSCITTTPKPPRQEKPSAIVVKFSSPVEERLEALGVKTSDRKGWQQKNYTEKDIELALAVTDEQPRENPLRFFRAALKEKWRPLEKILSLPDILKNYFTHGQSYNGAECWMDADGIGFTRGMKQISVRFNEFGFNKKVKQMLEQFGIKMPPNF